MTKEEGKRDIWTVVCSGRSVRVREERKSEREKRRREREVRTV